MSTEQIKRELDAAKKHYELDFLEDCEKKLISNSKKFTKDYRLEKVELPALTVANVAKVEAMIRADSKYAPSDEYDNSEYLPYWMRELGRHLGCIKGDKRIKDFGEVVKNVVQKLNKENSTFLNFDKNKDTNRTAVDEMIKRINGFENDQKKLVDLLRDRTSGELITLLSNPTELKSKDKGRHISFASKFCHYACFYIFEGKDGQDNFSICDSVVAKVLPYYLEYWKIKDVDQKKLKFKDKNFEEYREYCKAIDKIIKKSKSKISRNGFDHLLWYYFKDKDKKRSKKPRKEVR